jgi:hypothetical protein
VKEPSLAAWAGAAAWDSVLRKTADGDLGRGYRRTSRKGAVAAGCQSGQLPLPVGVLAALHVILILVRDTETNHLRMHARDTYVLLGYEKISDMAIKIRVKIT